MKRYLLPLIAIASASAADISFKKQTLTNEFVAEGAHFADFDHDRDNDICAGPYIWKGPEFTERVQFTAPAEKPYDAAKGYSDYFLTYTYDFNADGWSDILVFSWPGKETWVFENPQNKPGDWKRHSIFDVTDNESPTLGDMNGDNKPELICHTGGQLGYAEIDWKQPFAKAKFRAISPKSPENDKKYFKYTHGYGFGDVNGDGRPDILDKEGWREQPKDMKKDSDWVFHPGPFAPQGERGGSFILVYDVNGDKRDDVITGYNAHGYGFGWYEQKKDGSFTAHKIMGATPEENKQGIKFSQLHAMQLADINADGVMDVVTGKRRWAHGPLKDDEPNAAPVLYWWEIKRGGKGSVEMIPHLIDEASGVGTEVTPGDVNKDGKLDVVIGNKMGVFVFLQE
jgi:FG-GAP-like repeat/FG-GAP repeat